MYGLSVFVILLQIKAYPVQALYDREMGNASLKAKIENRKGDYMNNGSAIGYMILAARALGIDKDIIKKLESEMTYQMDMKTEDQAETVYQQF